MLCDRNINPGYTNMRCLHPPVKHPIFANITHSHRFSYTIITNHK
jgi:hypothetical protein